MPIRIDQIRAAGTRKFSAPRTIHEARMQGIKTAFLCHSHQDKELALKMETYLNDAGVRVYIDWLDTQMPEKPNRDTAERIKGNIIASDIFLFLATENSMSSRWCPWEIGYADGRKKIDQIVVIPTSNGLRTHGNEYIDLYRRIDVSQLGKIGIWRPGYPTGSFPMESTL
jgi:hypothetical protein